MSYVYVSTSDIAGLLQEGLGEDMSKCLRGEWHYFHLNIGCGQRTWVENYRMQFPRH